MQQETVHIADADAAFDSRFLFLRLLRHWKLILLSLSISLGAGYFYNERKAATYRLGTVISIKEDQNPFFTSNTSLTFNWGGASDKVNTAITILRSRSHNEEVVDRHQFYLAYQKEGKYRRENAYGQTPYAFIAEPNAFQAVDVLFRIEPKTDSFNLSFELTGEELRLYNYATKESKYLLPAKGVFSRDYALNEVIALPVIGGSFQALWKHPVPEESFYLSFREYNEVVEGFKDLSVTSESAGSSVLLLHLVGENRAEIADFLNASVAVFSDNMLKRKNLFATNTLRFIDSSLAVRSHELLQGEEELNSFRHSGNSVDPGLETTGLSEKLAELDVQQERVAGQLSYLENLQGYLEEQTDYAAISAPSVAGIQEESIVKGVARLTALAEERRRYQYSLQETAPVFADIDRQLSAVKAVLSENLRSSQALLANELQLLTSRMRKAEAEMRKLPQEELELLKRQRRLALSERSYNLLLEKRNEAGLIRAANVSDVLVIDTAKDTGQRPIAPNKQLNYVMAGLVGGIIPLVYIFLMVFLDTNVHSAQEVRQLSPIPILGKIGRNEDPGTLIVASRPNSALAEGFRGLRSSLYFSFRKRGIKGAKSILITSSVSGEGKTFCAINLACVFALGEKKTLLLGADLRKPKIGGEFNIQNRLGITEYLQGDQSLEAIIQPSGLPFLDVIPAGAIPPNPSELLMGAKMKLLMESLKQKYEHIVIDSPPVGVVADAFCLLKYADATLYIVRQDYTRRGMLEQINECYKRGEVKDISLVLNHFKYQPEYGAGFSYNYSRAYALAYGEDERKPKLALSRLKKRWRGFRGDASTS